MHLRKIFISKLPEWYLCFPKWERGKRNWNEQFWQTSQQWSDQNYFQLLGNLQLTSMPALKRSLHLDILYSLHSQSPDSAQLPSLGEMSHLLALISQADDEKEHLFLAAYLKLERKIKYESVLFPAFLQLLSAGSQGSGRGFLQENFSVLLMRVFLNAP